MSASGSSTLWSKVRVLEACRCLCSWGGGENRYIGGAAARRFVGIGRRARYPRGVAPGSAARPWRCRRRSPRCKHRSAEAPLWMVSRLGPASPSRKRVMWGVSPASLWAALGAQRERCFPAL